MMEDCKNCIHYDVCPSERVRAVMNIGAAYCGDYGLKKEMKEVIHAKWTLLDECVNAGVYCSACGKKVYKTYYANQKLKSKYCPNCGAMMDLE